MSDPLHVLFLPSWYPTPESPVNGIFNQEQARALSRAGVKIGVVYPELGYWRTMTPKSVWEARRRTGLRNEDGVLTYRHHFWYVRGQRVISTWVTLKGVRRYIGLAGRPHLLHAHAAVFAGFGAQRIHTATGIPYIITEHSSAYHRGMYSAKQLVDIRSIYEHAERVIMVSRAAAQVLVDLDLVRMDKITVIPNMVDTEFFQPSPVPRSSSPFRFLTVSLLSAHKRVDWLLRAFAQAFSPDDDVVLEIGGDGESREVLEQLARELGIHERVKFLGRLDRAGVRDAMHRANVFVLTSLFETFGVVLIEALATGLPVVSTDCGGPIDIVTQEVGLLVPTDQFDRLAPALRQMYQTHAQYDASAIRSYAERRFSAPVVTKQIIDVYNDVLGKND